MALPKYPVYVPSKGRFDRCLTARFLTEDRCPFLLVVEPQEERQYRQRFPGSDILVLPWNDHKDIDGNPDGLIAARNWIKQHSIAGGYKRHWQIDDNIWRLQRLYGGKRLYCQAGVALQCVEDFVDRYENVAVAGLNYGMFAASTILPSAKSLPVRLNCHVYSCSLILNSILHRWRLRYNDDTDLCLQVLADGWCTVQVNAFLAKKAATMMIGGGNTAALYQGDGRLRMARLLERMWPGVVQTKRRFGRPQHVINWHKFDTLLRLKPGVQIDPTSNDYGMVLKRVKPLPEEA